MDNVEVISSNDSDFVDATFEVEDNNVGFEEDLTNNKKNAFLANLQTILAKQDASDDIIEDNKDLSSQYLRYQLTLSKSQKKKLKQKTKSKNVYTTKSHKPLS